METSMNIVPVAEVGKSKKQKTLPFQIECITPANIQQLKTINLRTLPVRYSDKFYSELTIKYSSDFLKFAFWGGFAVGAICARVEPFDGNESDKKLYIMTVNVLPTYRRRNIASELLKNVLTTAQSDPTISEVYLHVQTSNNEAKAFYIHHGFEDMGVVKDYYKNIDPADSFLLSKKLVVHTASNT